MNKEGIGLEKARSHSMKMRGDAARIKNGLIIVAIIEAARAGANNLEKLAASLNSANVPTRGGRAHWTVQLASLEMSRMGYSIRDLHKRFQPSVGRQTTTKSTVVLNVDRKPSGSYELSIASKNLIEAILGDGTNKSLDGFKSIVVNVHDAARFEGRIGIRSKKLLFRLVDKAQKSINRTLTISYKENF